MISLKKRYYSKLERSNLYYRLLCFFKRSFHPYLLYFVQGLRVFCSRFLFEFCYFFLDAKWSSWAIWSFRSLSFFVFFLHGPITNINIKISTYSTEYGYRGKRVEGWYSTMPRHEEHKGTLPFYDLIENKLLIRSKFYRRFSIISLLPNTWDYSSLEDARSPPLGYSIRSTSWRIARPLWYQM